MSELNRTETVQAQYATSANLNMRISIHDQYSTNPLGFGNWIASQYQIEKGMKVLEKTLSTLIQRPVSFESGLNWFQPCASFESGFTFAQ